MPKGVYQIELNGRAYIGSSARDIEKRWIAHLSLLRKGKHHSTFLQNAYNKHGESALHFSILEIVDTPKDVIAVEQRYIDTLTPEYNVSPTAGSPLGVKHSAETRAKLSAMRSGRKRGPMPEEHRIRLSAALTGRTQGPHSAETRAKIAATLLGHTVSPEARAKISTSLTGRKVPLDVILKIKASKTGKPMPAEHRAKLSASLLGHQISPETREKISASLIGRPRKPHTPETKDRMRAAWVLRKARQSSGE